MNTIKIIVVRVKDKVKLIFEDEFINRMLKFSTWRKRF